MNTINVNDMKRWIQLKDSDVAELVEIGRLVEPYLPAVVQTFYDRLLQDPEARAVFTGGASQIARQREKLTAWLRAAFSGRYDTDYFEAREGVGRTHVKVELPQRFMFSGMAVIRAELTRLIAELGPSDVGRRVATVNRMLDLELAIMLESYRESYVRQVRAADRIIAQRQINEMEHMAHIGQLAASLAHEIKNPLAGISGAIQIISHGMDDRDPHRAIMGEILQQIDRLDTTVKDLLTYARPKEPELRPTDVAQTIRGCLTVLAEDPVLKAARIVCHGCDDPVVLPIDRAQFQQVIANLVLNAGQACAGDAQIGIELAQDDDGVYVRVRDNGTGMSDETRSRALEPFFTTKTRGTGLGLSICHRIVESHRGQLGIESSDAQGTVICIRFPHQAKRHAMPGESAA